MSSNRSSATNSSPVNGYYEISAENNNNNYILDTEDSNYRKGEKAKKSDSSLIMKSDNQIIRSDEVSDLSRAPFSNETWSALQYAVSCSDFEAVNYNLKKNYPLKNTANNAVPILSPLHIVAKTGNMKILELLIQSAQFDINQQDQWGFTPLHFAVFARRKDCVEAFLSAGASVITASKLGTTPLDIAQQLNFFEIVDILASKTRLESDPSYVKFREWLTELGGMEYLTKFLHAGYDLPFIRSHGLEKEDLDCIGIPLQKLGLRKKLLSLHHLDNYFQEEEEEEEDEEEEEEEEEEEDEEEEEEEEEEDDEE